MVKEVKNFFENVVKKRIKEKRAEDKEFNSFMLESNRKKSPLVVHNYSSMYDNYCNYARYILEKTNSFDMLDILAKYYPYVDKNDLIDLLVVLVASHIRSKIENRV